MKREFVRLYVKLAHMGVKQASSFGISDLGMMTWRCTMQVGLLSLGRFAW